MLNIVIHTTADLFKCKAKPKTLYENAPKAFRDAPSDSAKFLSLSFPQG